jgi:hypothetical protein
MRQPITDFNAKDLLAAEPDKIVTSAREKSADFYVVPLTVAAGAASIAGKPAHASALELLSKICLARGDREEADLNSLRDSLASTAGPFTAPVVEALAEAAPSIQDPELRATMATTAWLATTDPKKHWMTGRLAVDSLLESARHTEDSWPRCVYRTKLALRLAVSLGYKERLADIERYVLDAIARHGAGGGYLTSHLIELAALREWGAPDSLLAILDELAARAKVEREYHRLQSYLDVKVAVLAWTKDDAAQRLTQIEAAKAFLLGHDTVTDPGRRSGELEDAIHRLRAIRDTDKDIDELHARLVREQARLVGSMHRISHAMDVSQQVRAAQDLVRGKQPAEAIALLAVGFKPPTKAQAIDMANHESKSSLRRILPSTRVGLTGKTVSTRTSGLEPPSQEELKDLARQQMVTLHSFCSVSIASARKIVMQEHRFQQADMLELTRLSPFVPPHQKVLFAKGLFRGMEGRIDEAGLLLAPLIESLLRHVLEQRGAKVSSLDDDGIQKEWQIERVLDLPECAKVFGEDATFCLKSLLTGANAGNFRNLVAHGLLSDTEANGHLALSVWWWALRLCVIPIAPSLLPAKRAQAKKPKKAAAKTSKHFKK